MEDKTEKKIKTILRKKKDKIEEDKLPNPDSRHYLDYDTRRAFDESDRQILIRDNYSPNRDKL